ncbi:unnamed protein product [Prunus brigantina]
MNPPSSLATDGPILGLANGASSTPPPGTPRTETPVRQNTLEVRMEALQQEMAKIQEHNNILSTKLDETQRQLYEQQSHSAQLQDSLEQTMQLRQEQSFSSVPKPSSCEKGKKTAIGRPSTSRRLFRTINRREVKRHKDIVSANQSVPKHQNPSVMTSLLLILHSATSSIRSTGLRKNITKLGHQLGERYNQDRSLAESEFSDMTKKSKHSEYHFTQGWKIL